MNYLNKNKKVFGILTAASVAATGCYYIYKFIQKRKQQKHLDDENQNQVTFLKDKSRKEASLIPRIPFFDEESASNSEHLQCWHYDLIAHFDFEQQIISTSVNYHFKVLKETNEIKLDIKNLKVLYCIYDGDTLPYQIEDMPSKQSSCLKINLPGFAQVGGTFQVAIKMQTCKSNDSPMKWIINKNKFRNFFIHQGNLSTNRHIFACQDTPHSKASYSAQLQVPISYSAFTAGDQTATYQCSNLRIYNFEQKDPIPINMISFFAGALTEKQVGQNISVIFPSELNNLPENMEQLIKGYDSLDLAKKLQISTSNKIKIALLPPELQMPKFNNSQSTLSFISLSSCTMKNALDEVLLRAKAIAGLKNYLTSPNLETQIVNEVLVGFLMFEGIREIKGKVEAKQYREDLNKEFGDEDDLKKSIDLRNQQLTDLRQNTIIKARILLEDIYKEKDTKNALNFIKDFINKQKTNCKSLVEFKSIIQNSVGKKQIGDIGLESTIMEYKSLMSQSQIIELSSSSNEKIIQQLP